MLFRSNVFEQVGTSADTFPQVPVNAIANEPFRTHANTSEPDSTAVQIERKEIVSLLKKQLERAEHQLDVKDKQIDALLERDRETNILIQGLQTSLTGVVNALPGGRRERFSPEQPAQGLSQRDS